MEDSQSETATEVPNYITLNTRTDITKNGDMTKNVTELFVDQNGRYYYHPIEKGVVIQDAADSKSIRQVNLLKNEEQNQKSTIKVEKGSAREAVQETTAPQQEQEEIIDVTKVDVTETSIETISAVQAAGHHNQVILHSGDNNQIVTIVPSSTSSGELSYVLIVEQTADAEKIDAIYDFNEVDEGLSHTKQSSSPVPEASKKLIRLSRTGTKKSQTILPVHMCNYCNYTSPKRYLLSRHMRSHSEERPHKCSVCERGFKTLASLQHHVNTHSGIKPYQCKHCQNMFTTSGELVRHVRYIHTHEKPHKCTECNYASVELSKLKRHIRCHTGERPYQCSHCTYASPDAFKLKRHLRIHTGEKPYSCDECWAKFTQSNSLKAHKLIHSGNKPVYTCDLCPTTCGRKTDLRIHIQKLHTSDSPLECKKCGKSFPDRYSFKIHNKSHDGEKCFKCDVCPYSSVQERHLLSHMMVHTEEKPFKCDKCDQAFRQKQLLKRHQNLNHNPSYVPTPPKEKTHPCPHCTKTFRHKGNLARHLSLYDSENHVHLTSKNGKLVDSEDVEVFQGQDGNQYMVLEVIQLQGADSQVVMTEEISANDVTAELVENFHPSMLTVPQSIDSDQISGILKHTGTVVELVPAESGKQKTNVLKLPIIQEDMKKEAQKEVESCFGFEEEEEEL